MDSPLKLIQDKLPTWPSRVILASTMLLLLALYRSFDDLQPHIALLQILPNKFLQKLLLPFLTLSTGSLLIFLSLIRNKRATAKKHRELLELIKSNVLAQLKQRSPQFQKRVESVIASRIPRSSPINSALIAAISDIHIEELNTASAILESVLQDAKRNNACPIAKLTSLSKEMISDLEIDFEKRYKEFIESHIRHLGPDHRLSLMRDFSITIKNEVDIITTKITTRIVLNA